MEGGSRTSWKIKYKRHGIVRDIHLEVIFIINILVDGQRPLTVLLENTFQNIFVLQLRTHSVQPESIFMQLQ